MSKARKRTGAAALAVALLALVGCSGDDPSGVSFTTTTPARAGKAYSLDAHETLRECAAILSSDLAEGAAAGQGDLNAAQALCEVAAVQLEYDAAVRGEAGEDVPAASLEMTALLADVKAGLDAAAARLAGGNLDAAAEAALQIDVNAWSAAITALLAADLE